MKELKDKLELIRDGAEIPLSKEEAQHLLSSMENQPQKSAGVNAMDILIPLTGTITQTMPMLIEYNQQELERAINKALTAQAKDFEGQSELLKEAVGLIESAMRIKPLWCVGPESRSIFHEGEHEALGMVEASFTAFLSKIKGV